METMKKTTLFIGLIAANISSAYANWNISINSDEMTGKQQAFAISPAVKLTKPMSSPYNNVSSWIGVGCDGAKPWAFIGFNQAPNLSDSTTKDGYNAISTRIKWNEEVEKINLTQDWGAKFVHFNNDDIIIKKIASSNEVLLELNWYGNGNVHFNYPLSGSASALNKIAKECGFKIKTISFEDHMNIEKSQASFYQSYGISAKGNSVIAKTEGNSWKPFARDNSVKERIKNALDLTNKAALKTQNDFKIEIKIYGSTATSGGSSDGAKPFKGKELKRLLDDVLSKDSKTKNRVTNISTQDEVPELYTEEDGYPILVGHVKNTNERIKIHVLFQ